MMESMNGQAVLNGQGHLKGGYSHDERIMKNGSSGSNSSKYRFIIHFPRNLSSTLKHREKNLATLSTIKITFEFQLQSTRSQRK